MKHKHDEKVISLFCDGLTQQQIANEIGVCSRQRVQQIEKRLGLNRIKKSGRKTYNFKCQVCGIGFTRFQLGFKYCSRKCVHFALKKPPKTP